MLTFNNFCEDNTAEQKLLLLDLVKISMLLSSDLNDNLNDDLNDNLNSIYYI